MANARSLRVVVVGATALAVAGTLIVRHAAAGKRSAYERVMRETSIDSLRASLSHAQNSDEIQRAFGLRRVALDHFLTRYRRGSEADSVRARLAALDFERLRLRVSARAVRVFLDEHPRGVYADTARAWIAQARRWVQCVSGDSPRRPLRGRSVAVTVAESYGAKKVIPVMGRHLGDPYEWRDRSAVVALPGVVLPVGQTAEHLLGAAGSVIAGPGDTVPDYTVSITVRGIAEAAEYPRVGYLYGGGQFSGTIRIRTPQGGDFQTSFRGGTHPPVERNVGRVSTALGPPPRADPAVEYLRTWAVGSEPASFRTELARALAQRFGDRILLEMVASDTTNEDLRAVVVERVGDRCGGDFAYWLFAIAGGDGGLLDATD